MSREVMPARSGLRIRPRSRPDETVPAALPAPVALPDPDDLRHPWPGPDPAWAPDDDGPDDRGPLDGGPLDDDLEADALLLDADAPDLTAPNPVRAAGRPRVAGHVRVGTAAAIAVGCLVVGVLGGSGWSRQEAHPTPDDPHVFLWTDGAQVPADLDAGSTTTRLQVTLMATGAPVILQQVLLGAGHGEIEGGITLLPGRQTTADLVLHADCAALARDGQGVVADTSDRRAVVRAAGAQDSRQVPLDVLADSSALMLSLLAPCPEVAELAAAEGLAPSSAPGTAAGAAAGGTAPDAPSSAAVTVSTLSASSTGRLTFTLRSRGPGPVWFTLPLAATLGSRARFALRSRPALPVAVRPGATVHVTLDVSASCRSHTAFLPPTYGLLLPQAHEASGPGAPTAARHPARVGAAAAPRAAAEVPIEGWDDGVAAAALTAATLRGCH